MKVGLVLSGGFAKGAYQLGALRAISEYIPKNDIKFISGASIGALNSYVYITEGLDYIEDMWISIFEDNPRLFITEILRSQLFQQDIENICINEAPSVPFYTVLFDIKNKAVCYKELSRLKPENIPIYLKASVAFPLYNKAVCIEKTKYFDGGFLDNIPVYPCAKHDFDYMICVYFDDIAYQFENVEFDSKIIKITFPEMSNIKDSFLIKPSDIVKMREEGYKRTKDILDRIFENGYDDLPFIQRAISEHNKKLSNPKIRLTTDVVITNLNKALSRFAKRRIIF